MKKELWDGGSSRFKMEHCLNFKALESIQNNLIEELFWNLNCLGFNFEDLGWDIE